MQNMVKEQSIQKTSDEIEKLLKMLASEGEDATFAYIREQNEKI